MNFKDAVKKGTIDNGSVGGGVVGYVFAAIFFAFLGLLIDANLGEFFVLRLLFPLIYTGATLLKALKTLRKQVRSIPMSSHIERIDAFLTAYGTAADDTELERLSLDAVDEMMENLVGLEAVPRILALMERHPLASFGSPGRLVHFMEGFSQNGYDELLLQSVRCAPTVHTTWLLNRLINGADEETAVEYLQVMRSIAANEVLAAEIRASAKDFLVYHEQV